MRLPTPSPTQPWHEWATRHNAEVERAIPVLLKGQATLATGTSTTVSVPGLTKFQSVFPTPRTTTAYDAKPCVASVADGSFTLSHLAGVAGRLVDYLAV